MLRQQIHAVAAFNKERALGQDGLPSIPDDAAEALARFEEKVKSAREAVLNAAEGSLGNFFLDLSKNIKSSKEAFQDFARSFLADLARIFTQQVAIKTIQAIGLFAADGGVSPGTISGPSPVPAGVPTKAYSHGGVASSPQMAIFGEGRTREAFVPLPDNRRIPVKMEGGGGTVIQLTVTVPVETFDAKSFDDGILARAKVIGQAVISELVRDPALRGTVRQVAAGRA